MQQTLAEPLARDGRNDLGAGPVPDRSLRIETSSASELKDALNESFSSVLRNPFSTIDAEIRACSMCSPMIFIMLSSRRWYFR